MSGTDAAATLSLKIDTHGARADLEALKKEYTSLHAAMREGLPKLGGSSGQTSTLASQFKDVQASLSAVSAGVYSVNRALDDIVAAGGKFSNVLVRGAKEAVRQNALLTNSYTGVSAASATAAKSAVDYNALMGSAGKSISSLVKTNALLTDSLTSVSTVASAAGKSVVQYNSLMGTAAPAVAALVKTNALLTDSLTSVSTVASAAGKSVVQYNSLMGTAAPAVAALVKTNALLTDSLTSVSTVASAAGKSVVQYNSLMGTAAPAVAALVKTNALLTDSFRSVSAAASVAGKSVGAYDSLMNIPSVRPVVQTNALLTSSIVSSATASVRGPSATRYDPMMNTLSASLPAAIASVEGSHGSLASATDRSAKAQTHWNKVANEAHAAARGLAGSLGTLWITYGQLAPLLAGAAIGSSFIQAAKAGSEFAYQLTFVKALSQETSASLKLLGDSTLNLSRQSLQGPNDIASGYRILAQAGLDVTSSISAMPHVLHLATVGEMEMEQSAVTLIGVLNAFGLSISNVEHVGDVFAKAAALSQTSVQSMTEAMKTASVVGEQYGASLEDTATAITLLAKVNITGTSAGTAYRNMLKELYAPVPAAEKAFKNLGISAQDAMGNIRPFGDVIFDLKDKLEGFNKGDQIKILQRLFGERGAKEAVAMLSLTKDKWIELRDAINNSDGFMSGVAKELEDTAKGRWAQAVNTMKSSLIEAFSAMEPAFKSLADSFKDLFSDETFIAGLKRIVEGMLGLTKALVEAAPAVITLAEAYLVLKTAMIGATVWTAASTAMSGYTAALWAASGAMGPVAKGVTVANTALSFLPAGFAALMSPMGLVVGGLAAAGLAFYLFRDRTAEAMEASTEKVRGFAREAKVLLDEVAMTLHNSSVAMSQSRLSAAQTAVVASNETVDESAKAYLKKYGKGNIAGTAAAVESAEAYVRSATTVNSTGETYTTEDAQYKAAVALTQANAATRALQKKFYETQDQVRQKEEAEANLAAIKASQRPAVAKGNIDDILGKDAKTKAGGSNRGELKDARTLLSDNLSSGLKQEQIQLGREVIEIETQLAAQTVSATVAQEKKNEATLASLSIERMWIEQSIADAKALGDKVQLSKFENDLSENALKIEKQRQQANLDSVKARTADSNSINDSILSSQRYAEGLQFEAALLGTTALETAHLRAEREALLALENLSVRESRKQVTPDVADQERAAINANRDALKADAEFKESWLGGWSEAFDAYNKRATSAAQSAKDSFAAMASSMEDALVTFVTTGKLNFASFAKALIADIARIEARALMSKVLSGGGGSSGLIKGAIGLVSGLFGGGGTVGGTLPGVMTNGVAIMGGTSSANGNVFSGSPSLHAYANTVQTSPKIFAYQNLHGFAKGGVFAEAGPEAVMPLTRDSRGRLGVRSQGGGDGRITIINQTTGRIDRVSEKTLSSGERALIIEEAVSTTAAQFADPNSKTSRSMHRTFNLQRNR